MLAGCAKKPQSASPPPGAAPAVNVQFIDVTTQSGIKFVHNNGASGSMLLPETIGSGLAFIDYDQDGYQDLFFVNNRDWTEAELKSYEDKLLPQASRRVNPSRRPGSGSGATRHRQPRRRTRRTLSQQP